MKYSLIEHGDFLEKEAASFVNAHLCNYENIWKTYIGNTGNHTKAKIRNYNNDKKRQEFWELCYTVLESSYLAYRIIQSQVFSSLISTFAEYENFNKNFIAFFAHLGKMNDNITHAGEILGFSNIKTELKEYYTARHIAVHGNVIPISLDNLGFVQMPILSSSDESSFGWTVKSKSWVEGNNITHVHVADTCENLIKGILIILNNIFANYYNSICIELKELEAKIEFEYNYSANSAGSGSSGNGINFDNIQLPVSHSADTN